MFPSDQILEVFMKMNNVGGEFGVSFGDLYFDVKSALSARFMQMDLGHLLLHLVQ